MLSPATAHLNGGMNLWLGCPSHHLAGKPVHSISGYATNPKLSLCNLIRVARSEAPNLATSGSAEAVCTSPKRPDPLRQLRGTVFRSAPRPCPWPPAPFPVFLKTWPRPLSPPLRPFCLHQPGSRSLFKPLPAGCALPIA